MISLDDILTAPSDNKSTAIVLYPYSFSKFFKVLISPLAFLPNLKSKPHTKYFAWVFSIINLINSSDGVFLSSSVKVKGKR